MGGGGRGMAIQSSIDHNTYNNKINHFNVDDDDDDSDGNNYDDNFFLLMLPPPSPPYIFAVPAQTYRL